MSNPNPGVIAGFDCHLDTHTAAVLDPLGKLIATDTFPTTPAGYDEATSWICSHGPVIAAGVEGTGSYGAALTRHLRDAAIRVVDINQPHPHTRARRGKNDSIDAEAAARKVISGEATNAAKDTTGIVESIRQLTIVHNGAVKSRSAALCQLGALITTAPAGLREKLAVRSSLRGKANLCTKFRVDAAPSVDPLTAAKRALRGIARRISFLDDEIAQIDAELKRLVQLAAPNTVNQMGIGTMHAAILLVAAGENIDRMHSESAFAHLCGVAPIKASSGRTTRHRLNYGGNRQANRALHLIVIVRLRYCPQTQEYMTRRLTEGLTKKEVIRCLKRYVVREVHRNLRADLATLQKRLDAL